MKTIICFCLLVVVSGRPDHFSPALKYGAPNGLALEPTFATGGATKGSISSSGGTFLSIGAPVVVVASPIRILKDERGAGDDGSYSFDIETENGIVFSESGTPNTKADGGIIQQGSYSFPLADGQLFTLKYIADENGFQPESSFLPVAPEFPHPIPQFVLDQIAKAKIEDEQAAKEAQLVTGVGVGVAAGAEAGLGQTYVAPPQRTYKTP